MKASLHLLHGITERPKVAFIGINVHIIAPTFVYIYIYFLSLLNLCSGLGLLFRLGLFVGNKLWLNSLDDVLLGVIHVCCFSIEIYIVW